VYGDHNYGYGHGKLLAQAFADALGNAQHGRGSGGGIVGDVSSGKAVRESNAQRGMTEGTLEGVLANAKYAMNPASMFPGWRGETKVDDAARPREGGNSEVGGKGNVSEAATNGGHGRKFLVPDTDPSGDSRSSRIMPAKQISSSPTQVSREDGVSARASDARAEAGMRWSVGAEPRLQYRHGTLDWTQVRQRVHAQNDENMRNYVRRSSTAHKIGQEGVSVSARDSSTGGGIGGNDRRQDAFPHFEAGDEQEEENDASYLAFPGVQL